MIKNQILTIFLLVAASSILAADMPKRKSGLWEITTAASVRGSEGMAMTMCVDEKSDQDFLQQGQQMGQTKCAKQDYKVDGNRISFSSVCNLGKTTATTTGVATGDFGKEYKVESKTTYDPPMGNRKEAANTITAKWLGACKAGQRPGDVIMPNGMTMNLNDMMKMQKK
jgi:hypothetical protein